MANPLEILDLTGGLPPAREFTLGGYPWELITFVASTPAPPTPMIPPLPFPPLYSYNPGSRTAISSSSQLGVDFSCQDDLDPNFSLIYGNQVLAQDIYHRWTTRKGTLFYDTNWGESIVDLLNAGVTPDRLANKETALENEALEDDRVAGCTAKIVFNAAAQSLTITGVIQPQPTGTAFRMVVAVSKLTSQLLDVQELP